MTLLAVVRTGNIDEGEDTWLPDVTVEMLKEGTTSRSAYDIAKAAAGMGGALGLGVGRRADDGRHFGAVRLRRRGASNCWRTCCATRASRSRNCRACARTSSAASRSHARIRSRSPTRRSRVCYSATIRSAACCRDEGQLAGYDIAKLRNFYERNFGARRTHVYVAGRYDRTALEAALRRAFQDWRPGEAPTDAAGRRQPTELQLVLVDSPGAPQSSVRMAVPVPDPASALYFQTTLMNSLLGGTFGSRITSNIREDKGYSYSPNSSINARRGGALWTMSAEITAEHTAAAITEIFNEIERLQREAPAEAELTPVKNYRAGVFVISNSSPNGVLGQLAFMNLHGLPDDFLAHWVDNIQAVTPAQVSEMARQFVRPERMTVVVAGDLASIGDSVRALPQFAGAQMP